MAISFGELGTSPYGAGNGGTGKPAGVPSQAITVSSPVLDHLTNPEAWVVLVAQGQTSPGYILQGDLRGFEREEKWDVKSGKGTTGATTTHVAMEPAKGSITFSLPSVSAIGAWSSWLALWRFDTTKGKGQAVAVYHPALASVQPPITSLVMTKHTPVTYDKDGCGKATIEVLEYMPAKASGATTANGSKTYVQVPQTGSTGTAEDPAITKLRQQAAALQKQLEKTA